jgi:uncharacterized protein (UPF0303 family)
LSPPGAGSRYGDEVTDDLAALITDLERQEARLQFDRFDNDDAWELGTRLVELARERDLPVVIDIRRHGQLLFHAARPGTAPDNLAWVERKIRVVNRYNASSFLVGRRLAAEGRELDAGRGVDPADYATHGGSFPVRVRNVGVVGTVTVSGLPQADDHALVVAALEDFLGP